MVPCHSCHIYGIWTSRNKKVWGILKSHQLGVAMQVAKWGLLSQGRQVLTMQYCCTVKLYCKPYGVYTVKDFIGYLSSLYCCCFTCLRLAKPKVQLKVLMISTLNVLFQKNFQSFYFTSENSISLTVHPAPIPLCLFFPLQCLYCNF